MKLIFLPDYRDEWTIKGYHVGLWNETAINQLFYLIIDLKGKTKIEKRGELAAAEIESFSYLEFADISLEPIFTTQFWSKKSNQTGTPLNTKTKIKAKQFFSKMDFIPGTETKGIVYDLQELKETKSKPGEDLSEYTLNNLNHKSESDNDFSLIYDSDNFDLKAAVEFKNEIDLHIENLSSNHKKLNRQEKYQLQIHAATEFLDKAIKVGVNKVFLIHGIGKGSLKDGIKELLHKHPNVRRYKNEYHHRYGYGATEVDLR